MSQELNDPGHESQGRPPSVMLPVTDGVLAGADPAGDLLLGQFQVEPSLPQMIT